MLQLKKWFINTMEDGRRQAINCGCHEIEMVKETEKAIEIKITTDFGSWKQWAPKSAFEKLAFIIEINGKFYNREILSNLPDRLKLMGITRDELLNMKGAY